MGLRETFLALLCGSLVALLPGTTADACSTVASGLGEPLIGADGGVYWTFEPGSLLPPRERDVQYWLTHTPAGPLATAVPSPEVVEGRLKLLAQLPDGSAWWRSWCSDWNPPRTVSCGSLLLAGPAGGPLGRVSDPGWGRLALAPDGSLEWLHLAADEPAGRRGEDLAAAGSGTLQLWVGTPQPLASFEEPADPEDWHEDYRIRQANPPREGWSLVWEAPFPLPFRRHGSVLWQRRDGLLAAVAADEEVQVGVYELRGDGGERRLEPRWERAFPAARRGLPTDEQGRLALAPPWALALAPDGRLAVGRWQTNPDCSTNRPPGFVLFDPEGEVVVDTHVTGVEGLVFDTGGHLVALGSPTRTYDRRGELLDEQPPFPAEWEAEADRLAERAGALQPSDPVDQWVELYPYLGRWVSYREAEERRETAHRRIVETWPQVEPLLTDALWRTLAVRLCAEHLEAAPRVALERFREATYEEKNGWLEVLPDCWAEPPAEALAYARELAGRRGGEERVGAQALARWTVTPGDPARLWEELAAALEEEPCGLAAPGRPPDRARDQLLASLAAGSEGFRDELFGSPSERDLARTVLLGTLVDGLTGTLGDGERIREALLQAGARWAGSSDEVLAGVGHLLLLGHATRVASGVPRDAPSPDQGLRRVLAIDDPDLHRWAAVAVARVLSPDGDLRPPGAVPVPTPEQVGLARADLERLLRSTLAGEPAQGPRPSCGRPVDRGLEQARHRLARSLGDAGRAILLDAYGRESNNDGLAAAAAGARSPLRRWMIDDPASWGEAEIELVLERAFEPQVDVEGFELLDAVARHFPSSHPLHREALRLFGVQLDAAPAVNPGGWPAPLHPLARFLASGRHRGDRPPTPLATAISPADAERLVGAETAHFERSLWLLELSGPWPNLAPEVERLLAGNERRSAAIVLSHLRHPGALEVLLEPPGHPHLVDGLAAAIPRYGVEGVGSLLERYTEALVEAGGESLEGRAEASETRPILVEQTLTAYARLVTLLLDQPYLGGREILAADFLARSLERLGDLLASRVEARLDRDEWPPLDDVVLLERLGRDGLSPVFSRVEELPRARGSQLPLLFGVDVTGKRLLIERLRELGEDPSRRPAVALLLEVLSEHDATFGAFRTGQPR